MSKIVICDTIARVISSKSSYFAPKLRVLDTFGGMCIIMATRKRQLNLSETLGDHEYW